MRAGTDVSCGRSAHTSTLINLSGSPLSPCDYSTLFCVVYAVLRCSFASILLFMYGLLLERFLSELLGFLPKGTSVKPKNPKKEQNRREVAVTVTCSAAP